MSNTDLFGLEYDEPSPKGNKPENIKAIDAHRKLIRIYGEAKVIFVATAISL